MTKIAIFGLGPMRWERSTRLFALPLRTWHFAATLAQDGHDILLFSMRTSSFEGWPVEKVTRVRREGVDVYSLSEHILHERPDWIEARLAEHAPEAIVGVNRDPAALAVRYAGDLPIWADINGDPMAEAQAKAQVVGDDVWTPEFFRRFLPVLLRGDVFSTCSGPQRAALIGQLSMVGRLTGANAGHELVHAVPNSIDADELRTLSRIDRRPRAKGEPFVVLWSGGYNTWCDPDLLFAALELAMIEEPSLTFVSTGGGIEGHHTDGYERMLSLARGSRHAERYRFAGWVQTSELPSYYADAHAAILTDRFGYEGVLGARTRMLDWLAAGLPIVSTRLSEISETLEREGAALCAPCGDAEALSRHLLRLAREPNLAVEMGLRGRRLAREQLGAVRHLMPLREWALRPQRAPDGERRLLFPKHEALGSGLGSLARQWAARTRESGVLGGLEGVRAFATRRAKSQLSRVLDGAGLPGGVEVIELPVSADDAPEAPGAGSLSWRRRFASAPADVHEVTVVVSVAPSDPPDVLEWTIVQIDRQYFEHWKLALLVHPDTGAALRDRLADVLGRLEIRAIEVSSLRELRASGYLMLLGVGDLLRPDALAELVTAATQSGATCVYGDENEVDETNAPRGGTPKPRWSAELLLARPWVGRCALYDATVLAALPARDASWPVHAASYELSLVTSELPGAHGHRVARVLLHRYRPLRKLSPQAVEHDLEGSRRALEALQDALWRRGLDATATRGRTAGAFEVRFPIPLRAEVTVALPIDGPPERIARCIEALRARTRHAAVELVLARTRDHAAPMFSQWPCVVADNVPAAIDAALRSTSTSHVAWIAPSMEVVTDGWLEELLRQVGREGVSAAAPKLLTENGTPGWPTDGLGDHVRPVTALPPHGGLLSRADFVAAGGLVGAELGLALAALSKKLDQAILVAPRAALFASGR